MDYTIEFSKAYVNLRPMKIENSEIAPSGKRRLKIYLGDEELEIMHGLVQQALKHTPSIESTKDTLGYLRNMNRTFESHYEGLKNEATSELHAPVPADIVVIQFDGGTPSNVPSKGYGIGYGSYTINGGTPERLNHGFPMSANTAEVMTVRKALAAVILEFPTVKWVRVIGDSQIALKWVRNAFEKAPLKVSKGSYPEFKEAIEDLYIVVRSFDQIITEWQPRHKMVAVFGH